MKERKKRLGLSEKDFLILKRCYYAMRSRCYNTNIKNYKYYGARGVKVCADWMANREEFFYWAINNGWKEGLELDREDNNGDYTPTNCRWATKKLNMRNTRRTRLICVDGVMRLMVEVIEEKKLPRQLFVNLIKGGKTPDEAIDYLTKKRLGEEVETKWQERKRKLQEYKKIIDENFCFFGAEDIKKICADRKSYNKIY